MATNLSIKGKTQANDAVTSTINYVNPGATDAQLISLATAMNDMTTNSVVDITKIEKNSLLNTIEKLPRNLTLSTATISAAAIPNDATEAVQVTLSGDGNVEEENVTFKKLSYARAIFMDIASEIGIDKTVTVLNFAKGHGKPSFYQGQIEFTVAEDSNYQSDSVTLTIGE